MDSCDDNEEFEDMDDEEELFENNNNRDLMDHNLQYRVQRQNSKGDNDDLEDIGEEDMHHN